MNGQYLPIHSKIPLTIGTLKFVYNVKMWGVIPGNFLLKPPASDAKLPIVPYPTMPCG